MLKCPMESEACPRRSRRLGNISSAPFLLPLHAARLPCPIFRAASAIYCSAGFFLACCTIAQPESIYSQSVTNCLFRNPSVCIELQTAGGTLISRSKLEFRVQSVTSDPLPWAEAHLPEPQRVGALRALVTCLGLPSQGCLPRPPRIVCSNGRKQCGSIRRKRRGCYTFRALLDA